MRDTCVPRDSEVVKLNSAPSGRRVFTASYSLPIIDPSFPICTSFNRKLTCRLNGIATGGSVREAGWVPPPSRSTSPSSNRTSRSRVDILAFFVSKSRCRVLLEGEGTNSSWFCSVRNVSLAACSSCTDRKQPLSQGCLMLPGPAAQTACALNRFTTTILIDHGGHKIN